MKPTLKKLALGGVLSGAAAVANALPNVTLEIIESRFIDPVGGNVIQIDTSFGPPNTPGLNGADIYWAATGSTPGPSGDASGYLVSNVPTPETIDADGTIFDLAIFAHFNKPITAGTAIDEVTLEFLFDVTFDDDAGNVNTLTDLVASFLVEHDETTNAEPCPYPTAGDPCSDRVVISEVSGGDNSIVVGDLLFDLDIIGFSETIGGPVSPVFDSEENGTNQRFLAATVTATPVPVQVPAPGALALLGLGLLGLGLHRRRLGA